VVRYLLVLLLLAAGGAAPAAAQKSLHLVLTPSQKPTDLAAGEQFGQVLGRLVGAPVRVTVASWASSAPAASGSTCRPTSG
jgi:hypothetical protein